ncbi:MAG: hypothetical protein ACE5L7_03000 [Candidatus Aminicenantales bacterium]
MKRVIQMDTYTRIILTIIALCLIWICLRDIKISPSLYAADSELVDVRIKAVERGPGERWDPFIIGTEESFPVEVKNMTAIPVEVKNELLPVDVKSVRLKRTLVPLEENRR